MKGNNMPKRPKAGLISGVVVASVLAVTVVALFHQERFEHQRRLVLAADPARLQLAGAHFIVGFKRFDEVRTLAARGAIAGIYLTRRNVAGKKIGQIRAQVDQLQTLRRKAGLPPLIVAADQEGGTVNHLSPPLPPLPPLASLVGAAVNRRDLARRTDQYARSQARGLAALGINLNLSPVVDLPSKQAWLDGQTWLARRAIAEDKATVAEIAAAYCRAMQHTGIWPTLKHFPGLGQVAQETHQQAGTLDLDIARLSVRDWVPFRQVLAHTGAFLMLGHVRLAQVDRRRLVCASPDVVQGILRGQWRFNGILMTDDLTMGAVRESDGGIGVVAVQALNAGVDLLLISFDGRQYYPAMAAVLRAMDQGSLNFKRLTRSRRRLAGLWQGDTFQTARTVLEVPHPQPVEPTGRQSS
jgi:beta-N-acetylhexosaminidase